ncbi:MAG: alpha-2-macroglobulin [Acidovorax sp.]|jgi:uncharacterized protein YfaS (alpha-2-macroglobulin family)|nr:alpha-2-macroglobulin [Acidovorax sp.]
MKHLLGWAAAATVAWTGQAQALDIQNVTPQGQVAEIRQLVVRLDADAVALGSAEGPAPVELACTPDGGLPGGSGRWNNAREWVWQWNSPLPPGTRCAVTSKKAFKSVSGATLTSSKRYQFETAGPFVRQIWPRGWQSIDEEQYFALQLSGAATRQSLVQNVYCQAEDVGERIPVRWIEGKERDAVLQSQVWDKELLKKSPDQFAVLTCNRRLTAGSSMQLIYGKGVAGPQGVVNREEKRFDYAVREAFSAEMRCERENAQAGCLPVRPVSLYFSAAVSRAQAQNVRLVGGGDTLKPALESEGGDVRSLRFEGGLKPLTSYKLELPKDLHDDAGRPLRNASMFPLAIKTGDTPLLAKFAAAPFGIVERFAEGPDGPALLPVTLRKVESQLDVSASQVGSMKVQSDADIIRWLDKVNRYHEGSVSRKQAGSELKSPLPPVIDSDERHYVATRQLSLLQGQSGVERLQLPKGSKDDPRPFEVVGIPLSAGFHVVEIASPRLGESLLDERYGSGRTMYVRTATLVTNLAVHFKLGREGSMVWVTSLDKGKSVADAQVQVSTCSGKAVAQGRTDAQGMLRLPQLPDEAPRCDGHHGSGAYFVSARATQAGVADMAFTWSDWQKGIEPWRFNVPVSWSGERQLVAHTVMDRTLVRAGETVSMKHFLRTQSLAGLDLPKQWPQELVITHTGSGQQFKQALQWRATSSGGKNAESSFAVPRAAKLGEYEVELRLADGSSMGSGSFRVEAFRLPVLQGQVAPVAKGPLVRPSKLEVGVRLDYVNGGAAAGLPVQVTAMVRPHYASLPGWDDYSFGTPQSQRGGNGDGGEDGEATEHNRIVLDRAALKLDKQGQGQVVIDKLPASEQPQDLVLEATYADPNGEIQTLRSTHTLWPSAVVAAVRAEGWVAAGQQLRFQALALGLDGKPKAGVSLAVKAVLHTTSSSRKRMVGGFYTYDNHESSKDLGEICSGSSDSRGLLLCNTKLEQSGEVELIAIAKDDKGNAVQAATSVWITRQGELWFGGQDHDRMDLLPEKRSYEAGETARLQVRMPFRQATALVTVEREGILDARVVELSGDNPTVDVPIQKEWGPNVYVSVMALRGRLVEVPWYSFFTWGYKTPRAWWQAFWHEGKQYVAPTALVDLSKPAYRLGMTELQVGQKGQTLQVSVTPEKNSYRIRETARVTIEVKRPDGKPAAGAEVALAAVDQALLELMPNTSWQLRDAMWQRRSWGVQTATAQMEIIGRRHYGKKAVPAGGGGGRAPTRELLDTLLLWNPHVVLDAHGKATVNVPLNDALTAFRIAAVADDGVQWFGTGEASIRTTQDLQIVSGLPPLVREGDQFRAQLTLRNTTAAAMQVELSPRATWLDLKAQTVDIPAGESREVVWEVTVPAALGQSRSQQLLWEVQAKDKKSGASDTLKISQRVDAAVPLSVQQSVLQQLDGPWNQQVNLPANALPGRGGLRLNFSPQLAGGPDGLPGVRAWWERYPYTCLEQTTSRAIGLKNADLWRRSMENLPTYLDSDGLALYFPVSDGQRALGSDSLTAHLLNVAHAAAQLDTAFAIPSAQRAQMESGLIAFIEGRLQRKFWSPRQDLQERKLAAIAALALSGKAQARMLGSIDITPVQWPTHTLIDWITVLQKVQDVPQRAERLAEAQQQLRSRLSYHGSQLAFSTDAQDRWWWLMHDTDSNAARLLLLAMADTSWHEEVPRMVTGLLARQQGGAWSTTTANVWGGLALRQFSRQFESTPVNGTTTTVLGAQSVNVDWKNVPAQAPVADSAQDGAALDALTSVLAGGVQQDPTQPQRIYMPWGERRQGELRITHHGAGKPWVTLQSLAAVPRKQAFNAGYAVRKTITAVQQGEGASAGSYQRGDVLRVRLEVEAGADMTWAVINDPIPAGATILGSGLGRDSEVAVVGQKSAEGAWPAFEERAQDGFRAYYAYLPKGKSAVEYTMRLNNAGTFALPPTRVEALYAPEMFGEAPNATMQVKQATQGKP